MIKLCSRHLSACAVRGLLVGNKHSECSETAEKELINTFFIGVAMKQLLKGRTNFLQVVQIWGITFGSDHKLQLGTDSWCAR